MDTRQTEIRALQQYVQKSKEELQKLEQQLKEQKVRWVWAAPRSSQKQEGGLWNTLSFLWKGADSLH